MRPVKFQSIHQSYNDRTKYVLKNWGTIEGGFTSPGSMSEYKLIGHREYTGLADKNDKDIYEGDIMSLTNDGRPTAIIVFEPFGGFSFKWHSDVFKTVRQRVSEPIFHNVSIFEVIGNIYENPELLK